MDKAFSPSPASETAVPQCAAETAGNRRPSHRAGRSRKVYIAECAVVTGLGPSLHATWSALMTGATAISRIAHFNTDSILFHNASVMSGLTSRPDLNRTCVLTERALVQLPSLPPDTPVIWTGSKAGVEMIESGSVGTEWKKGFVLASQYREWVSRILGLEAGGMEINAACASATAGLTLAAQWIRSGKHKNVLVCGTDIVSRFVHFGFSALKALSPSVCRPFDRNRDGLCLGEGSFAIRLTSDKRTASLAGLPRIEIQGESVTNDATHITGPAKDGSGLIAAMRESLAMAGLESGQVEVFCAHGTGTVYNDAMELTAVDAVFGGRRFPVFSVKGAIGHTLGAAGGIEAALCVKALRAREVPPTAGLSAPDPRAEGRVSPESQVFGGRNILTTNSGFGGVNAALMLTAEAE